MAGMAVSTTAISRVHVDPARHATRGLSRSVHSSTHSSPIRVQMASATISMDNNTHTTDMDNCNTVVMASNHVSIII